MGGGKRTGEVALIMFWVGWGWGVVVGNAGCVCEEEGGGGHWITALHRWLSQWARSQVTNDEAVFDHVNTQTGHPSDHMM